MGQKSEDDVARSRRLATAKALAPDGWPREGMASSYEMRRHLQPAALAGAAILIHLAMEPQRSTADEIATGALGASGPEAGRHAAMRLKGMRRSGLVALDGKRGWHLTPRAAAIVRQGSEEDDGGETPGDEGWVESSLALGAAMRADPEGAPALVEAEATRRSSTRAKIMRMVDLAPKAVVLAEGAGMAMFEIRVAPLAIAGLWSIHVEDAAAAAEIAADVLEGRLNQREVRAEFESRRGSRPLAASRPDPARCEAWMREALDWDARIEVHGGRRTGLKRVASELGRAAVEIKKATTALAWARFAAGAVGMALEDVRASADVAISAGKALEQSPQEVRPLIATMLEGRATLNQCEAVRKKAIWGKPITARDLGRDGEARTVWIFMRGTPTLEDYRKASEDLAEIGRNHGFAGPEV